MARKNLKILLALAPLGLGLNGAASAADLGAPFMKAPAAMPYYSWTGYYIGANVGYGVGQGDGTISYGGAGGVTPGLFSFNSQPAGVIAGGQAGYNWQFGSIVLGVETDIQGSAMRDNGSCFANCMPGSAASLDQKLDWFGTTRARVGWATGPVLTYVTGGVAYGQTDVTLSAVGAAGTGIAEVDSTRTGWTWGTGVEAALDANWTAKAEWLYVDLGSTSGTTTVGGFITKNQEQIFRGGVNYHFGDSGSAAALPAPTSNWTGFYIGGTAGYALGRDPATFAIPGSANATFDLSPRGLSAGGLVGYNWQFGHWVTGIDADFQGVDDGGDAVCAVNCSAGGAAAANQQMPWFGTVRGRLGYSIGPALFYGTGGYAYGQVKDTVNEQTAGAASGFSFTHSNSGWAAGAGIENPFDPFGWFGKNWTTRTEYLYVDLGDVSDTFSNGANVNQTLSSSVHSHIWRTSLIYKFSGL
jgi:outer membrane immunogenic protein